MSLRTRLALVAAGVVAVVVALASTATYFLMRHELFSQVDTQIAQHANDRNAVFGDFSPYAGDYVAVVAPDGSQDNPHNIPIDHTILEVAVGRTHGFFRNVHVTQGGVPVTLRERVQPLPSPGGAVVVVHNIDYIGHDLDRLRFVLILVSLGGIVLAAGAGRLVAGATFAPVRRLTAVDTRTPDALVLDVMMPGLDGLDVTRRLRRQGNRIPILLLTARDAVGDRVEGLDAGADDYLPKPYDLEELLARLRALLRRSKPEEPGAVLRFADLTLDLGSMDGRRGSRRFELTTTEAHLLELFMRNPRQVLPRSLIYERVWGYDFSHSSNALDVYVGYLRRKTEADEGEQRLIHTVRGTGYMLREP